MITEVKADIAVIKEGMMDVCEMKEMFKEFKKSDKNSKGGENSVNDDMEKARNEER